MKSVQAFLEKPLRIPSGLGWLTRENVLDVRVVELTHFPGQAQTQ